MGSEQGASEFEAHQLLEKHTQRKLLRGVEEGNMRHEEHARVLRSSRVERRLELVKIIRDHITTVVAVGGSLAHQRKDTITWNQVMRNHIDTKIKRKRRKKNKRKRQKRKTRKIRAMATGRKIKKKILMKTTMGKIIQDMMMKTKMAKMEIMMVREMMMRMKLKEMTKR